jgi:hypothetical protein
MSQADGTIPSGTVEKQVTTKQGVVLAGLFATLLGAFVRLAPAIAAGFPISDGGLFYTFVTEIQAAGFRLPVFSDYNHAGIPFLYPPLSFYLTGLLSSLTGASVLGLVRFLPPLISVATVPAFYLLARKLIHSELPAAAAAISYALLPTAFDFMVVGGGLPRALGVLFCILTLHQAVDLFRTGGTRRLIATVTFATLTILSHPVVAWFMLYSLAILFVFRGRTRRGMRDSLIVGAAVLVLTSPWWGVGIARHGLDPYLAVVQAGSRSWSAILAPFLFLQTNELYLTLLAVFALLGLFLCLHSRQFLLPAWLALVFVLETRLTATYAAIPTALLAGIGYAGVILPALSGSRPGPSEQAQPQTRESIRRVATARGSVGWVATLATGYFVCYLLVAAFLAAPREALPEPQREAMAWVRTNTPAASQFAVVSGIEQAGIDCVSEWFPALADRVSVSTPQGYEWFPGQVFNRRWERHAALQDCADQDARCVESWAHEADTLYTHVYLVKSLPGPVAARSTQDLYQSLLSSPDYEEIYNRDETSIFSYQPVHTHLP